MLALAGLTATAQAGGNEGNPGVAPPEADFGGMSYGEWAGDWWEWFDGIASGAAHPGRTTGEVLQNQSGHVWFLNGVTGAALTRDIEIPSGTALFFPLLNVFSSNTHTPPFFGATEDAQRAIVNSFVDHAVDLACTIDGEPMENLDAYRTDSPQFSFVVPALNRRNLPAGTEVTGVTDGYWVLVRPMSVGDHTIRLQGKFDLREVPGFGFILSVDTTYNITVVPRGQY